MKSSVFSLQRLVGCKKIIRAVTAVALCALTAPAYSGGLASLVKGVTDRTTIYLYAEQDAAPYSTRYTDKSGIAAIVYSPVNKIGGNRLSSSASRVAAVSNALDGRYMVTDMMLARDYVMNAEKKDGVMGTGITSGAMIGFTILIVGIGLAVWSTNDDGNRSN